MGRAANNLTGIRNAQSEIAQRLTASINHAINRMRSGSKVGVDALADKICEALQDDTVGTLQRLSAYMPKKLLDADIADGANRGIKVIIQRDNVSIQADGHTLDVATSEPVQAVIEGEVEVDVGVSSGD